MTRRLSLIGALCLLILQATAANNRHVLKFSTDTYTELAGATPVTSAVLAYDSFLVSSMTGETYNLFGKPITFQSYGVMIRRDARIQISEDTAFAIIDALYSEFDSIDNSSSVSYKIDGSGNDKIFKVQWKNMKVRSGPAGNYINVQTWVYQKTGIIEYRYGPSSANNASGYTVPSKALYIGVWYSDYSFAKMYEKMQVSGLPPNYVIDSVLNWNVPHIQGAPPEGTVIRYVPKQVAASVSQSLEQEAFRLAPNPAANELTISLPRDIGSAAEVSVTDMQGKKVINSSIPGGGKSFTIRTVDIPSGIYQLSVSAPGITFNEKIVIQH